MDVGAREIPKTNRLLNTEHVAELEIEMDSEAGQTKNLSSAGVRGKGNRTRRSWGRGMQGRQSGTDGGL